LPHEEEKGQLFSVPEEENEHVPPVEQLLVKRNMPSTKKLAQKSPCSPLKRKKVTDVGLPLFNKKTDVTEPKVTPLTSNQMRKTLE